MKKPDDQTGADPRPLIVSVRGAAGVAIARAMLAAFRPRPREDEVDGGNG